MKLKVIGMLMVATMGASILYATGNYYVAVAATQMESSNIRPGQTVNWNFGWSDADSYSARQEAIKVCQNNHGVKCWALGIDGMRGDCVAIGIGSRLLDNDYGGPVQTGRLFTARSQFGRDDAVRAARSSCEGWVYGGVYESDVLAYECKISSNYCSP